MINITEEQIMEKWDNSKYDHPVVSVRCTAYNHEKYIRDSIEGFLIQKTNFPFEIVIHDDASTDSTADIIREYEKKYPSIIKPIYETENQYSKYDSTMVDIINKELKGDYIAFCEGDDYWIDENKLQKQVDFLQNNPEYGMCFTDFNMLNQNDGTFTYDYLKNNPQVLDFDLESWIIEVGRYIGPMTWLVRRELWLSQYILKSLDGTFVYVSHYLKNSKIHCIEGYTSAVYRKLTESASHSKDLNKLYIRNSNLKNTQISLIKYFDLDMSNIDKIMDLYYTRGFWLICVHGSSQEKKDMLKCSKLGSGKKMICKFSMIPLLGNMLIFMIKTFKNIKNH